MMTTHTEPARTMAEIRSRNAALGHHFFQPEAMRFFRSRVLSGVYVGHTATWFVTSEQFREDYPRLYSVRVAMPGGDIDTVGEFQRFESIRAARAEAKRLAAEDRKAN